MRDEEPLDASEDDGIEAEYTAFRVSDYLGWQRDGSLELRPRFQRGFVWKEADRSLLVDSILRGYPVPLVILQEEYLPENRSRKRVVDGQQRLRTLISFIEPETLPDYSANDAFLYVPPGRRAGEGKSFNDLTRRQQRTILGAKLPAVVIDAEAGDPAILEVYDRLNTTGMSLKNQELRFAKRPGPFSELCYQLARRNQNRWINWRIFREQDVARMLEVELTSELALLLLDGIHKTGVAEINDAYSNRLITPSDEEYVAVIFQRIMDAMNSAYASPPTRNDPIRTFRSRAWFYTFFSFFAHKLGYIDTEGHREEAPLFGDVFEGDARFAQLPSGFDVDSFYRRAAARYREVRNSDTELAKAVSGAASDRRARMARFNFLNSIDANGE